MKIQDFDLPATELTTDLPSGLLEGIGRIIVIYSSIEQEAKYIIAAILGITTWEGRLIITEPSTEKNLQNIKHLINIHKINITKDINQLITAVKGYVEFRNWLAHGVWTNINGTFYLQIISGEHVHPFNKNKIKRKIIPTVHLVKEDQLQGMSDIGVEILADIVALHSEFLAQRQPLLDKQSI